MVLMVLKLNEPSGVKNAGLRYPHFIIPAVGEDTPFCHPHDLAPLNYPPLTCSEKSRARIFDTQKRRDVTGLLYSCSDAKDFYLIAPSNDG